MSARSCGATPAGRFPQRRASYHGVRSGRMRDGWRHHHGRRSNSYRCGAVSHAIERAISGLTESSDNFAVQFVDAIRAAAKESRASDIHFQPERDLLRILWRVDGVLRAVGTLPGRVAGAVVARLKILAELLTYRCDLPPEGRLRDDGQGMHVRVSTFPTLFGERATVRLFTPQTEFARLRDLRLPAL